jgi:outer membrane scaffolding protein for murein synthesis (MipA/OmpV family)
MIIRAININKKYQYSKYKIGWVFEVVNDFGEYYTARVLSGSNNMHNSVIAIKKIDCEELHLGSYNSDRPITMIT